MSTTDVENLGESTPITQMADLKLERDATRIGRAWRARGSDRQGRCELARLVRGLNGR
jgi:hypothetical protein